MTLSIIVTIYNCENYLQDLFKSFSKNLENENIEFIFVNDKSTDNSLKIIQDIKGNKSNFKIINNKINLGLSKSRNIGAKKSTGDWLWFFDGDDQLADNVDLNKVIHKIATIKEDIFHFRHLNVIYSSQNKKSNRYKPVNNNLDFIYSCNDWSGMYLDTLPWNKIFRRNIFDNNEWMNTINEDVYFIIKIFITGHSVYFYNEILYYHLCAVPHSIMSTDGHKFTYNAIKHIKNISLSDKLSSLMIISSRLNYLNRKEMIIFKENFHIYKNNKIIKWYFSNSIPKRLIYFLLKRKWFILLKIILKLTNDRSRY